jgi:hypothetical protein
VTASDICFWLADNMALWRDPAIILLAGIAVGSLWLAYGAWEEM